jgi:hypothetical protein
MNRRRIAGLALAASPVLVAASHFLWPAHSEGTDREQIAAAGAHSSAWLGATVVETIGWLLLVPAFVEIWSAIRGRGRTLVGIGAWLSIAGVFGYFGAGIMNVVTIDLGRQHDPAIAVALMHSIKHDSAMFWLLVAPLMLGTLAFVVAFAGLARAGVVGWWAPVAVFVSLAVSQVLSESDNAFVLSVALVPMIAAAVVAGREIARDGAVGAGVPLDRPAAFATA